MISIAEPPQPTPVTRDIGWQRSAHLARQLAWLSLIAVLIEGAVGLWQGLAVGSVVRLERRDRDGVLHLRRLPAIQELLNELVDEDKTR